jgi:hypothetical protein
VTAVDRRLRGQRTTALTCGVMSELLLATVVLVWSGSAAAASGAPFGRTGSIAVVVAAMVVLVVAIVVAAVAARLGRGVLVTVVSVFFLVFAAIVVVAVTVLGSEPGVGFLLLFSWASAVPVALHIRRAGVPSSGQR